MSAHTEDYLSPESSVVETVIVTERERLRLTAIVVFIAHIKTELEKSASKGSFYTSIQVSDSNKIKAVIEQWFVDEPEYAMPYTLTGCVLKLMFV